MPVVHGAARLKPMKHHLDFEKPIAELQSKLEELKKHPETHSLGISVDEEVASLERKLEECRDERGHRQAIAAEAGHVPCRFSSARRK